MHEHGCAFTKKYVSRHTLKQRDVFEAHTPEHQPLSSKYLKVPLK